MLIVEIDVVNLEVFERLFTGFPHVFRLSVYEELILVEEHPELGTNEHLAPEIGILKQRSQEPEPLILSLLYPRSGRIPEAPTNLASIYLLSNGCESIVPLTLDVSMRLDPSSTACNGRDRQGLK
jgi:hypothetical protein